MIEQLKFYDLLAKNLFETIIYVKELYENDFTMQRGTYKAILNHLTKDIDIPITTEDVIKEYDKILESKGE